MEKLMFFIVYILKLLIKIGDLVILTVEGIGSSAIGLSEGVFSLKDKVKTSIKRYFKKNLLRKTAEIDIFIYRKPIALRRGRIILEKKQIFEKIKDLTAIVITLISTRLRLIFRTVKFVFVLIKNVFLKILFIPKAKLSFPGFNFLKRAKKRGRKP
ncbi:hypothetical protein KKG52_03690, partial [Patescibacteria group bacterium]|nr:hypothetical protein [Patescibacteria group bacterium]